VKSCALGVNSYLVKPVGFDRFTEAVGTLGLYWLLPNEPPTGQYSSARGQPTGWRHGDGIGESSVAGEVA
jgi:hypothetical protein